MLSGNGKTSLFLIFIVVIMQRCQVESKKGFGPGEQDWGFVKVNDYSHMFYWLYYTQANVSSYTERPLVIWLQGGPGVAGSYFGNFNFLGPLDTDLNDRNETWTQYVNLVFVDCPVGIGFSYVDNFLKYPKSNNDIALNLVEFMKGFYERHPEFIEVPVLISGESYGGKMAAEFALEFYKSADITSKLTAVILINSWISPKDIITEIPTTAYYLGIIDQKQREVLDKKVDKAIKLIDKNLLEEAIIYGGLAAGTTACTYFKGASVFNIDYTVLKEDIDICGLQFLSVANANNFMNGPVKDALNITESKWSPTFIIGAASLGGDILKPSIHIVNQLLNSTDVHVNVASGNHDLLIPIAGTLKWIERLDFETKTDYDDAPRDPIFIDNVLEGYEKISKNLSMFWIQRAGHMVAKDNLKALSYILKKNIGLENN